MSAIGSIHASAESQEQHVLRRLGIMALLLVLAFTVSRVVEAVGPLGRNIPQSRLELDYGVGLVVAIIIAASIFLWPVPHDDKRHLLRLWVAKCVVTLGFMLVYEWNYGLDAYGYFNASRDASPPGDRGFGAIGFSNGTANMHYIAWLVAKVVPNSYHGLKVVFSFVGLIGIYLIYRATTRFKGDGARILYIVGLFPSCLFWSSIVGKDPVQLLGIGLYVYGIVNAAIERRTRYLLVAAAGVAISMFVRLWSGPILVLPLVVFPLAMVKGSFKKLVLTGAFVLASGLIVQQVANRFNLESAQGVLATAQQLSESTGWEGGSTIRPPGVLTSPSALVAFAPKAMFTALFRPLPGEVGNVFGMLAGLENAVLLALVAVAVVRYRRGSLRDPIVLWAILLVLGWSVVYGFSVYNLGSLVRFKLQILPVMLLLLLHLGGFGAQLPRTTPRLESR